MKLRAPFDLDTVQPEPIYQTSDADWHETHDQPLCATCQDPVHETDSYCANCGETQEPNKCRHCGCTNTPLGVCDRCYVRYYESATA